MPFLRAPYYRRLRSLVDSVAGPIQPGNSIVTIPGVVGTGAHGPVTDIYYNDHTPSNLSVYDQVSPSVTTDGEIHIMWTDNTGGTRHHRLSFNMPWAGPASENSWFVSAQYNPSITAGRITGLTQTQTYNIAVQSVDTADNFISQRTYTTYALT